MSQVSTAPALEPIMAAGTARTNGVAWLDRALPTDPAGLRSVAITGASGLIGQALQESLRSAGLRVVTIGRNASKSGDSFSWNPARGELAPEAFAGVDAVVHLAGEGIASGRWTTAKKQRILASRVEGTELLCRTLASLDRPPRVLVSASAIGYYGDRGDAILSEDSTPGKGFLADVGVAWEEATRPATDRGLRVVNLRIGIVLSPHGGALKSMLLPFQFGAGGPLGHGGQYMSWISLPDMVGAIEHALRCETLRGPVNAVAPEPVTNRDFTKVLARVLRRPAFLPAPRFALRLALGEMSDALLMASTRVLPIRLIESGYSFQHATLEAALRAVLNRPAA